MQIRATPYVLQHDGLGDLLTLLTTDLRRLPVVLLSPYPRGERNLIDADQLSRNLAGVAVVVSFPVSMAQRGSIGQASRRTRILVTIDCSLAHQLSRLAVP
jgi:hypothetical protein